MKIGCPRCCEFFEQQDQVYIDEFNTIIHPYCYEWDMKLIKDKGTFKKIVKKHVDK